MVRKQFGASVMLVFGLITGCATGPSSTGKVSFQLATAPANTSGSLLPQLSTTVTVGADVLVISQVQLVARKIEFERVEGSCAAPTPSSGSESEGEQDDVESDDCPELRLGPLLLDPPLSDGAETTFSVDLPVGRYHEMKLKIHKPTESSGDAAFLALYPDFLGTSIRVTGTFNGLPFTFNTAITSVVEIEFDTPIDVTVDGTTNVTLMMDVRGWFLEAGGTALLNPGGPNSSARNRIEQNIRASFHAFHDQDSDGHED